MSKIAGEINAEMMKKAIHDSRAKLFAEIVGKTGSQQSVIDCAMQEIESLRQQLDEAQVELEAERRRRFEGNRISSEEYNDSQKEVALMRDVVWETNKYLDQTYADLIGNLGAEWLAARIVDHLSPILSKALAATADLDGLILCHAEPYAFVYEYQGQGPRLSFELQDPKIPVAYYWQEKLFIAWNPKEEGK